MKGLFRLTLLKLKALLILSLVPSAYGVYNLVNNIVTTGTSFNSRSDVFLTVATMLLLSTVITVVLNWSFYKSKIEILRSLDK